MPSDIHELKVGEAFNPYKRFFGIFIPAAIVRLRDLSQGAKICYGRLLRFAGKDGDCFPRVETLAAEIGVGERQTQNYLAELQQWRLIRKVPQPGSSDRIEFLWHEAFIATCPTVNDASAPAMKNPSQAAHETSFRQCTMLHPKRIREVHHHEESQIEKSQAQEQLLEGCDRPHDAALESLDRSFQKDPNGSLTYGSPCEELIALVRSKGQDLSRDNLRRISDDLELRGVSFERFVEAVRPHFRNNIVNATGFLLSRARDLRTLLGSGATVVDPAAATIPAAAALAVAGEKCPVCSQVKGQGAHIEADRIVACECATPEWRAKVEQQEEERLRRAELKKERAP